MRVELSKFRIKPDKHERTDEWLKVLNSRVDECVATLEREKMQLEIIFRERRGGEDFLYWLSIQEEGGEPLETSPHEIDKIHREFGRECIDTTYGAVEPPPQLILVPTKVATAMAWEQPHMAASKWTGDETWRAIDQKPKDQHS